MRHVVDRVRANEGRKADRQTVEAAESAPMRLRLRRKLGHGDKYRKADRRRDDVADLKLHEGVDEILRWLRTA